MPVGEEGDRIFEEHLDAPVSIPRDEYGGVPLLGQEACEPIGVLIEKRVYGVVELSVVYRGRRLEDGKRDWKADDYNRSRLRVDRARVELLWHPRPEGRILPALRVGDAEEGDLHLAAPLPKGLSDLAAHHLPPDSARLPALVMPAAAVPPGRLLPEISSLLLVST